MRQHGTVYLSGRCEKFFFSTKVKDSPFLVKLPFPSSIYALFLRLKKILFFLPRIFSFFLLMICISLPFFVLALSSLALSPPNLVARRDLLFQNGGHSSCLDP